MARKKKPNLCRTSMDARRVRLMRKGENKEQREKRLESQRLRSALARSLETKEEREARLSIGRHRQRRDRYRRRNLPRPPKTPTQSRQVKEKKVNASDKQAVKSETDDSTKPEPIFVEVEIEIGEDFNLFHPNN